MTTLLFDSASNDRRQTAGLVLAHGAGMGYDSPFMVTLARALNNEGINVWRFEFPYMQRRREDGRKRPPDRQPVLLDHFASVIRECRAELCDNLPLLVGGKSMGGRMASLLAASPGQSGLIQGVTCFGYPFHPPGKPGRWRTDHFTDVTVPMVVFQGTRDPFGKPAELEGGPSLPDHVRVHWLEGGNHDLRPLKRQGLDPDALINESALLAAAFIDSIG